VRKDVEGERTKMIKSRSKSESESESKSESESNSESERKSKSESRSNSKSFGLVTPHLQNYSRTVEHHRHCTS